MHESSYSLIFHWVAIGFEADTRHDTEIVVEKAIEPSRGMRHGAKILDIGTDSGGIAISVASCGEH